MHKPIKITDAILDIEVQSGINHIKHTAFKPLKDLVTDIRYTKS